MAKYKKCPRCELNYILEAEEYCSVCLDELKGVIVNDLELEEEYSKLCPRCGVNYIADDQEYCEVCRAEVEELHAIHDAEDAPWADTGADGEEVSLDEMVEDADEDDAELDEALVLDESMLAELESAAEDEEDEDEDEDGEEDFDDFDDLDDLDFEDEDEEDGDEDEDF